MENIKEFKADVSLSFAAFTDKEIENSNLIENIEPHEQEILPEFTLSKNIFDKISDLPKGETLEEQRMYSEGEVYELLCHFFDDHVNAQNANISQWFEQNKKK